MKAIKTFKMFRGNKSSIIMYHGTDIIIHDANEFSLPIWITPDLFLAMHFCLNPVSSSRDVERGYIYKLEISNPRVVEKDKRRFILEGYDSIRILEAGVYIPDPITFAKKIGTII